MECSQILRIPHRCFVPCHVDIISLSTIPSSEGIVCVWLARVELLIVIPMEGEIENPGWTKQLHSQHRVCNPTFKLLPHSWQEGGGGGGGGGDITSKKLEPSHEGTTRVLQRIKVQIGGVYLA